MTPSQTQALAIALLCLGASATAARAEPEATAPTFALSPESYIKRWRQLYQESEQLEKKKEGAEYNARMLRVHNKHWKQLTAACEKAASQSEDAFFIGIAILGKDGTVQDFLTMPPRPGYQCYRQALTGQAYPAPPAYPYPISFLVPANPQQNQYLKLKDAEEAAIQQYLKPGHKAP